MYVYYIIASIFLCRTSISLSRDGYARMRGCERCVDVLLLVRLLLKFGLGGRAPDLICRSATYDVFSSTSS